MPSLVVDDSYHDLKVMGLKPIQSIFVSLYLFFFITLVGLNISKAKAILSHRSLKILECSDTMLENFKKREK